MELQQNVLTHPAKLRKWYRSKAEYAGVADRRS
jgi:hypothetical protein